MDKESASANDLWVFREGKTSVAAHALRFELENAAASLLTRDFSDRAVVNALLRAGEFEASLGDAEPGRVIAAERLTDLLALCLWEDQRSLAAGKLGDALRNVRSLLLPETLHSSPPEGFAYYGLHPWDFAALADEVAEHRPSSAAIVGIRSIGTTLSAIVLAGFRRRGIPAERHTVRPQGHPYNRVTRFIPEQLRWIEAARQRGSEFLVVDEGPGRSGSSFLSVGEALEGAGVAVENIRFVGSRPITPDQLCADNAVARWNRFQFTWPAPRMYSRFGGDIYIGGGDWRKELLSPEASDWPASWQQMERFKFLSADRKTIYKFDGFGRFGEEVLARALRLANAGFGPKAEFAGDGMIQYPVLAGRALTAADISTAILRQVAGYCAFRAREFQLTNAPPSQLADMLVFNVQHEFGVTPDVDASVLSAAAPVLCDGRMQLWEWIATTSGQILKVDGCTHGDDHFFPGPTDIAWDLAGLITEWSLDNASAEFLLAEYQRRTGDDVSDRLAAFLLAYSVFRMAYCKMALSSVEGTPEYHRLQRAAARYHNLALQQLRIQQQTRPGRAAQSPRYPRSLTAAAPPRQESAA